VADSDVLELVELFEEAEAHGFSSSISRRLELDSGALRLVQKGRDQLARALRVEASAHASLSDEAHALTLALLVGYPDRVGRRRERGKSSVVFAGGGSGELADESVVREAEFLLCVGARRQRQRTLIDQASAITAEDLLEVFFERIESYEETRFDPVREQVEQVSGLRYDGLVLDQSVRRDPTGEEVAATLASAALSAGLQRFVDMDELHAFSLRVGFARRHGVATPEIDDARIEAALRMLCTGRRSFADLKQLPLVQTLLGMMEPGARASLDRCAPLHASLPGRAKVPVHYEAERDPWIASRMQDFFGLQEGPRVAGGAVPLVLHLLAPNRRAVQVTTDLVGFWERHYPKIASELRRRYPRHRFPEDPRAPSG
jgi:ATP-dependent helicase HrpB